MRIRKILATAFFSLEAMAATVIVIEAMALFALIISSHVRTGDILAIRQRAALAAEAVLNEIRSGHEPAPAEFAARFPRMTLETRREPGADAWSGCTRLRVRIVARARNGTPTAVQVE